MARKGIPGLSFSWKRALGITAAKQRIARMTGIPTTRQGRQAKLGRSVAGLIGAVAAAGVALLGSKISKGSKKATQSRAAQTEDMRARKEYIALKNISEGNPANLADITNPNYVTKPPLIADIHAAPTEYKPTLTELGKAALKNYIQQFRQDK